MKQGMDIKKEEIIMNEMKLVLNTKNVRNVAFAVGFGLTMGKFAGDCAKGVMNGVAASMRQKKRKMMNLK